MSSYTPKPYAPSGKASSLQRFNSDENKEKGKSQTLPNAMPAFSGDILKQRLAAMQNKKPPIPSKKDQHPISSGPVIAPVIDQNELKKRRDSMNRTPAPPTPDAKQKQSRTPEFLRKKLKPTVNLAKNPEQGNEDNVDGNSDGESKIEETKKSFRNSRLLFENISAAPKVTPKPAPKPALRAKPSKNSFKDKTEECDGSKTSEETSTGNNKNLLEDDGKEVAGELDLPGKSNAPLNHQDEVLELEGQSDMVEESREALDQPDGNLDLEDRSEVVEEVIEKPNITIPEAPVGLDLWMNYFVKNNATLVKLDEPDIADAPPPIHRALKPPVADRKDVNAGLESENGDEIYDDVASGQAPNDRTSGAVQGEASDDIYDDVAGTMQNNGAPDPVQGAVSDDLYDDIVIERTQNIGAPEPEQDENYDDVLRHGDQQDDDMYDDVKGDGQDFYEAIPADTNEGGPLYEVEEGESGEQAGDALYEPVETIAQYVCEGPTARVPDEKPSKPLRSDVSSEKGNKKKEERERKERERLEKKKREDAEKQRKRDEEEKKRKDKEERKRIEKERKLFNLRPDEDPIPIERHMAACDVKGKNKDLSITQGEYLDVISKNNCPKGKVLVQNKYGKLGYVQLKDLGMDKRMSLITASSPIAPGVAFGEFEEETNSFRGISANAVSSEIISLSASSTSSSSFAPSFGQSRGVFQLGQNTNTVGNNEEEGGDDFYDKI